MRVGGGCPSRLCMSSLSDSPPSPFCTNKPSHRREHRPMRGCQTCDLYKAAAARYICADIEVKSLGKCTRRSQRPLQAERRGQVCFNHPRPSPSPLCLLPDQYQHDLVGVHAWCRYQGFPPCLLPSPLQHLPIPSNSLAGYALRGILSHHPLPSPLFPSQIP